MALEHVPFPCGGAILVLWGAGSPPGTLKDVVDALQDRVGLTGRVQVEHMDRLILSDHTASTFDGCVSGQVQPTTVIHSQEVLTEVARILRPGSILCFQEPTVATPDGSKLRTPDSLYSAMKLAGFINVSKPEPVTLTDEEAKELKMVLKKADVTIVEVQAQKPDYEVGTSSQLKLTFAKPIPVQPPKVDASTAQVWSLSADDILDDDVDVIDDDELLDEEDLKKPEPESLRASCDGAKKRKACKNCSCGLAEELEGDAQKKPNKSKPVQSSCGSCYLGDAFRCASCPYLGMPAFKPGDKVQLSDRQLNADA